MVTEGTFFGTDRIPVIALPARSEFLKLDIVQGRDLLPGDTDAIVLNTAFAGTRAHPAVGQTVVFRVGADQLSLRVVGITREQFSPPVAYMLRRGEMVNSIRLALDRSGRASIDDVKAALDQRLEREQMRSQAVSSTAENRFAFDQHMVMIYVFLVVVSSIIGAIGGLGLMTTMSLNVMERRREMGVLRAIGATPAAVWLMVVAEGVMVGVLSWVIASVAAWPLTRALSRLLMTVAFSGGLDFAFELSGLLVWLAVSVFLGLAASLLPAWSASRTTVREALSHE